MLTSFRNLSQSWITKAFLVLLALSFAIWGIGDMFRSNPSKREVATIGDSTITVQELESAFQQALADARRSYPEITASQARQMGVLDRTLNVMVEQSAFDQEAERLGLSVGKEVVLERLAAIPEFRDKDGKFRTDFFQQALRQNGMTEQYLIEMERKDMARRLLLNAVSSSTSVPKTMIDNIYQARGSKRILEIVSLRNDSVQSTQKPDNKDLQNFYEQHKETFVAPEYRGITIARLSSTEAVNDVIVTLDEVKKAYEANASAYTLSQRRDIIQVVLQDEAKAKEFSERATSSKDLSKAAKAMNLTPITMKNLDDKTVLPALYTTVFGLEKNEVAGPVKSSLGYHVLQITEIHEGGQQPFDAVKETIRRSLQEERVGDLLAKNVNQLDDMIAGGAALEEIADTLKLRLTRYPAITAQGKIPDTEEDPKIPSAQEVLQAAFSQDAGQISQVIEEKQGNYLVVRTDKIESSHTRAFEDVKNKVMAQWMSSIREERAVAEAKKIADEMRNGKKATSYASLPGINVRLSHPISLLGDMDKDLIPTAIQHVFDMKQGDVITLAGPDRQYIIRLADVVPVDPQKPEPSRLKVVDDLKRVLPLEMIAHYSKYVKEIFPVYIDSEIFKSLRNRSTDPS